ncbi:MAG: YbhB/YbcL family Raf kinase inhibitor-like protein [Elusimicrobiales bacterium]|jgi:hypothetical protein
MRSAIVPVLILVFLGACGPYAHKASPAAAEPAAGFVLASEDFRNNDTMPRMFACTGQNISPDLRWSGAPPGTKSFILTMKDLDAPGGDFLHWAVVDIPATANGAGRNAKFPPNSREFQNDAGGFGYTGPCPPSGTHRYIFSLYAVDTERLNDAPAPLEEFIKDHTLAKAVLTGVYRKQ